MSDPGVVEAMVLALQELVRERWSRLEGVVEYGPNPTVPFHLAVEHWVQLTPEYEPYPGHKRYWDRVSLRVRQGQLRMGVARLWGYEREPGRTLLPERWRCELGDPNLVAQVLERATRLVLQPGPQGRVLQDRRESRCPNR